MAGSRLSTNIAFSLFLAVLVTAFGFYKAPLSDRLNVPWAYINDNVFAMLAAWNHYLSLSNPNQYFSLFSHGLLIFCLTAMRLRAARFKVDAVYPVFILGNRSGLALPGGNRALASPGVYIMELDRGGILNELNDTGFECSAFQDRQVD